MTTITVKNPFPYFTGTDGKSLESGKIYIGVAGLDAKTNPITIYWDDATSIPAAQPIRTVGGYPDNGGAASSFFAPGDFSIVVDDAVDVTVYSKLRMNANELAVLQLLDVIIYDTIALFLASTEISRGVGAIWKVDGSDGNISYKEVVSNGDVQNSAPTPVEFEVLQNSSDQYNVRWFGAVGDGIIDDTAAFISARDAVVGGTGEIIVPFGTYLITSLLDLFRVSMIGGSAGFSDQTFDKNQWPILKQGPALSDFIRLGPDVTAQNSNSRTKFKNFTVDMTIAPVGARGVFADHGVSFCDIDDIYVRGANAASTAIMVARDQTGIDIKLQSASDALYYNKIGRITAFNMFKGVVVTGLSGNNDGFRVNTVDQIEVWNSPQGITMTECEAVSVNLLAISGFMLDYDPSGQPETEWGIKLTGLGNSVNSVYMEGLGSRDFPLLFTDGGWRIQSSRRTDQYPDWIQGLDSSGNRASMLRPTFPGVTVASGNVQTFTFPAGAQINKSLTVNPYIDGWTGGGINVNDGDVFATGWVAHKEEVTATLRVTENSSASGILTGGSSSNTTITNPVVDNLYGIRQDIGNFLAKAGTLVKSITNNTFVTIAVRVQPFGSNPSAMRFRIEVDQGVVSSSKEYKIAFDPSTAGVDQPIVGAVGDFWTLILQVDCNSNATKFEIAMGVYPEDTASYGFYIDSAVVIPGRQSQYSFPPYVESPLMLQPAGMVANANTPSGATVFQIPVFDPITKEIYYIPAYSAPW